MDDFDIEKAVGPYGMNLLRNGPPPYDPNSPLPGTRGIGYYAMEEDPEDPEDPEPTQVVFRSPTEFIVSMLTENFRQWVDDFETPDGWMMGPAFYYEYEGRPYVWTSVWEDGEIRYRRVEVVGTPEEEAFLRTPMTELVASISN